MRATAFLRPYILIIQHLRGKLRTRSERVPSGAGRAWGQTRAGFKFIDVSEGKKVKVVPSVGIGDLTPLYTYLGVISVTILQQLHDI